MFADMVTKYPSPHSVTSANPVDLLVDLSPVVVSLLSSPWHGELGPAWMPGSYTDNLVGLAGQLFGIPSAGDTWEHDGSATSKAKTLVQVKISLNQE